jgi:hypothetical protein
MKLRFLAREDQLAREPGHRPAIGQAARYIGRTFVASKKERRDGVDVVVEPATNPATKDGSEYESDHFDSKDLDHLLRLARKGSIWPADKATAEFCGVDLASVEFKDGAWVRKSSAPELKKASA